MSKVTDVVTWVMKDEAIIKLEKANKRYDISEAVTKFLESKDLFDKLEDKTVDVEIDESTAEKDKDGTSGLITRLSLSDGKVETKKEEPQITSADAKVDVDTPSGSDGLITKTIKIGGVSVPNESAVDEETKEWYNLDSTISAQKFKEECTGKEVEITVLSQEKGNDVIKSYNLKAEGKKDDTQEPPKKTGKKTYRGNGNSIEAQAAMKAAYTIIASIVHKDSNGDEIVGMITKIATHSYELIQELKNKE